MYLHKILLQTGKKCSGNFSDVKKSAFGGQKIRITSFLSGFQS